MSLVTHETHEPCDFDYSRYPNKHKKQKLGNEMERVTEDSMHKTTKNSNRSKDR